MDEKDRKIISILRENGRATLSEIGQEIGMTAMGVKKRLNKLESGVIRLTGLLNAERLEIITAIISMEVENSEALGRILKKFEKCPRIIKFFVTTGGYNLFALIWAEDKLSFESVTLEQCSLRSQPGIRRCEVYPIQEIYYDPFLEIKINAEKSDLPPCGADCESCNRFVAKKCLGCPASKIYRGVL